MRTTRLLLAAGAAILIAASVAVRFVAAPALVEIPANLDTTVQLSGTASMPDPTAIRSGNLAAAVGSAFPVIITNRARVVSTQGDTAVIASQSTVTRTDHTLVQTMTHTWAVNRRTLYPAPPPPGSTAESHDGLVVGFPLRPQSQDYPWWDPTTQTTTTARYLRTETYSGRQAYVYAVHASGAVQDPQLAKSIPLRPLLGLTSTSDTTFWVDTASSYVLNVDQTSQVTVSIAGFGLPVTVFSLKAQYTPQTATTMHDGAQTAGRELDLLRTVAPLVLLFAGITLGAIAIRPRNREKPVAGRGMRLHRLRSDAQHRRIRVREHDLGSSRRLHSGGAGGQADP